MVIYNKAFYRVQRVVRLWVAWKYGCETTMSSTISNIIRHTFLGMTQKNTKEIHMKRNLSNTTANVKLSDNEKEVTNLRLRKSNTQSELLDDENWGGCIINDVQTYIIIIFCVAFYHKNHFIWSALLWFYCIHQRGGRQANDKNRSSFSLNLLRFMDYAIVLYSLWVRAYFQIAL